MKNFVFLFGFFINVGLSAQPEVAIEKVNQAIDQLSAMHIKTKFFLKPFNTTDTLKAQGESWIVKNPADTMLGMSIRNISYYEERTIEIIHRDSITFFINSDNDSITRYNLNKGHWNGFTGNTRSSWSNENPLLVGIKPEMEDSVALERDENNSLVICRYQPDMLEMPIKNIKSSWWIDESTWLPYRYQNTFNVEGQDQYRMLEISLLDSSRVKIEKALNQPLPKKPVKDHVPVDPARYKPLPVGSKAPNFSGYFLEDSSLFELASYMDSGIVFIDFWYQTCAPCIRAIPYIDSLQQEYAAQGLSFFAINSRDHEQGRKALSEFYKKRGGTLANAVMTELENERDLWNNYSNPAFYLVKNGEIVHTQIGFSPQVMPKFREEIEKHISDE
ncbi:MAG: TlpA family protein disulfide reductase [Luteibaculum sp.]